MSQLINRMKSGAQTLVYRASRLTMVISVLLIILTLVFLYGNFYRGIQSIQALTLLKSQVAIKPVKLESWEKVRHQIEVKKQPLGEWQPDYLPFY